MPILHFGCGRMVSMDGESEPDAFSTFVSRPWTTSANIPSPPTLKILQQHITKNPVYKCTLVTG